MPPENDDQDFFAQRGSARSAGMHPEFSASLRSAIEDAEAATGEKAKIESLTRTRAEQAAAYQRYRSGQGGLAVPPGTSRHEYGQAGDIASGKVLDWLHQNADQYGLSFLKGADFKKDPGHIQWAPQRSAYADEGAAVPDLLGSYVRSAETKAPEKAAPSAQEDAGNDLLGSWAKALPEKETASGAAPLRLTVHPARPAAAMPVIDPANMPPAPTAQAAAPEETMPQALARWTAEHQGNSYTDQLVRTGAGVARGVGDVGDTLAQGIAGAGSYGANLLAKYGIISPQSASSVQDWRRGVLQGITQGQQSFDTAANGSLLSAGGRIGGQIAGTAPFLGLAGRAAAAPVNALTRLSPEVAQIMAQPGRLLRAGQVIGSGALGGAAAAGLTSSTSNEPVMDQMTGGATAGAVLGPIGAGLGRIGSGLFGAGVDANTAQLAQAARNQYGIPLSATQISGNRTVRFLDSILQRLPMTGYADRTADQLRAINRVAGQTFGENTDAVTPDTIRAAKARLGPVFNDVARRTGAIHVDPPAATAMMRIMHDAQAAPENVTQGVQRQIRNILSSIDPATRTISAESYQALTRKGAPLNLAQKGGERTIAHYADQLREVVDDMMQRSAPPDGVRDLLEARGQWRAMKAIEPLAEKAGPSGISPTLIRSAVNKSYPNMARAPGEREQALRDMGQIGQRFIKEENSSGTSERLMIRQHLQQLTAGVLGIGSVGAASYFDPESWQRNVALAGGGIAAGRLGSAALRSNVLANALIRSGLRGAGGGGAAQEIINRGLPAAGALINRQPLQLTVGLSPDRAAQ